ncbi:MAG: hypothetical protein RL318_2284 [Fibrobacterota bacterium]|jgi:hypothetical protein
MHVKKTDNGSSFRQWRKASVFALVLAGLACADTKPTLTVLPPQAGDASPEDAQAFRAELDRVFRSNPDVRFVEANSSALEEVGAQAGCLDADCSIQAGRVLDAERVVSPVVRKEGEGWVMTLRLVDARSGEVTVSKSGLSGSASAAGAATDFASALTEPIALALHVVEAPVIAATPPVSSGLQSSATDLPPMQAPSDAAPASTSSSGNGKKILLWTAGGLVLAGGVAAAVVVLMGGKSTPAAENANNGNGGNGGGTPTDATTSVTVRWK